MRKILSYSILLVVILWLVFSYIPAVRLALPTIAFPTPLNSLFQWLLFAGLIVFIALQGWVVAATAAFFRPDSRSSEQARTFQLTKSRELIWTALPILMTLLLALASFQTWASLTPP